MEVYSFQKRWYPCTRVQGITTLKITVCTGVYSSLDFYLRFEVLMRINMKIAVFSGVTPCSLAYSYKHPTSIYF
jgi:hypothetical protein